MRADGQALSYNFDEPSLASRALGLQLYTPLMLSKDNGNKGDDDPRYDLTAECDIAGSQHGRSCRWRSLLDMLDFGTLTFGWDWLYTNRTEDTPQRWMYPTTVVELGKGWVRGVERIITKVDGTFAFEASAARQFRGCTDHSSKERRRPLLLRPFWTVTQLKRVRAALLCLRNR